MVRAGAHGESVTLWSGTVGRIDRRAGKVAEIATVVVVYRREGSLAYAVMDWPHRHTVEWGSWTDTPDRYVVRTCGSFKGPPSPCVALLSGGPQWDPLLVWLGGYEPPASTAKSTLMTGAVLYATGLLILIVAFTVAEARTLRAHA